MTRTDSDGALDSSQDGVLGSPRALKRKSSKIELKDRYQKNKQKILELESLEFEGLSDDDAARPDDDPEETAAQRASELLSREAARSYEAFGGPIASGV